MKCISCTYANRCVQRRGWRRGGRNINIRESWRKLRALDKLVCNFAPIKLVKTLVFGYPKADNFTTQNSNYILRDFLGGPESKDSAGRQGGSISHICKAASVVRN